MGCLHDEAKMKQLRAHIVHVYFQYICFMFASSCKHPITGLATLQAGMD